MPKLKLFKNKQPIYRRKKELIVILISGSFLLSIIFLYTYINNSPLINTNITSINIRYEDNGVSINYDTYIDCVFELNSEDESDNIAPLDSKIKLRGSDSSRGSRRWPKKGYRIELSNPRSLLGMRKDDDWNLFQMYLDFPRMRIKTCFDLWNTLESSNPTAISPRCKYVILYINGEFQGLYLLVEKTDRILYNLDDPLNNAHSSLIFQAKGYTFFQEYQEGTFEQDWPNEDEGIYIMDQIMTELVSFVNNTSNEEFFNPESGIYSKFDKLNLIDFFIFNFFILHKDFWHNNYFIVRNTYPNKFFLIPWDYDYSFGQYAWLRYDPFENPEEEIHFSNNLFARLMDDSTFMKECKSRWLYLREHLWTGEFILDMVTDNYEEIEDILEFETNFWNPKSIKKEYDNNLDESIADLYEWIPKRFDFCDSYFAKF